MLVLASWPETGSLAVIVVVPTATAVTRPLADTIAIAGSDEVQVTLAAMSITVSSVSVASAASCKLDPDRIVGAIGETASDTTSAPATSTTVLASSRDDG